MSLRPHAIAARCGAVTDSWGSTCSTECVDEAGLLLADEVQVQLVPALVDVLLQPLDVLAEVAGDAHRLLDLLG